MKIAIDINDVIRDYIRAFKMNYNKGVDHSFNIEYDDITEFDLSKVFPFLNEFNEPDNRLYNKFKYEDYAYEIFGRADVMERNLPAELTLWTQNTLRNFDEGKNPEVMLVSPFEMNLSIQSTLSFLARIGTRIREIYFPVDSSTIWDKCDILITANPNLINNVPEGKTVIKINAPYNKDTNTEYTFDSLSEVINDKNKTLIQLIESHE